jgi:hypothetical protein
MGDEFSGSEEGFCSIQLVRSLVFGLGLSWLVGYHKARRISKRDSFNFQQQNVSHADKND